MNIIITGASSGIGFETALKFCKDTDHQVLALARNKEKLEILRQASLELNPGSRLIPFAFDLEHDPLHLLDPVMDKLGTIDILINNAGALVKKTFLELNDQDWQKMFSVNVLGPVRMIRKVVPLMGNQTKAHIVNIGSMAGFQGSVKFPGLSAYAASKAALVNLTEVLAEELKGKNIAVNCLAIGSVQTEMLNKAFPGFEAPLKAYEMAEFIADFALNAYKYINGKVLPVALNTP